MRKTNLGFAEEILVVTKIKAGLTPEQAEENSKMFDWDKAATIINKRGAKEAAAGLAGDWSSTSGPILSEGKPVPEEDTYVYLASCWAIPCLEIDNELIPCFKHGKEAKEYWPESALKILKKEGGAE